mgnify:CR=1 FL=1
MAEKTVDTLNVKLNLDTTGLSSGAEQAKQTVDKMQKGITQSTNTATTATQKQGKSMQDLIGTFGKVALAVGAVVMVIRKAVAVVNEMVQTASESQENYLKLAIAMRNATDATDAQVQSVIDYNDAMKMMGVVDDDTLNAAEAMLATQGLTADQLTQMSGALGDVIAKYAGYNSVTQDGVTIAKAMTMALNGSADALQRYGITLSQATKDILSDDGATQAEKIAALTADIESSIGGTNAALGATYQGHLIQITNALGDIKEELGYVFENLLTPILPVIEDIVSALGQAVQYMDAFTQALTGVNSGDWTNAADGLAGGLSDANDQADELSGKLLGFDKFNSLDSSSGSTGSSTSTSNTSDDTAKTATATNAIADGVAKIKSALEALHLPELLDDIEDMMDAFGPILSGELETAFTAIGDVLAILGDYFDTVVQYMTEFYSHANENDEITDFFNNLDSVINEITSIVGQFFEMIQPMLNDAYGMLGNLVGTLYGALDNILQPIIDSVMPAIGDGLKAVADAWNAVWALVGTPLQWIFNIIGYIATAIGQLISGILQPLGEVLSSLFGATDTGINNNTSAFKGFWDLVSPALKWLGDVFFKNLIEQVNNFLKFIQPVFNFLEDSFDKMNQILGYFGKMWKQLFGGDLAGASKSFVNIFIVQLNCLTTP